MKKISQFIKNMIAGCLNCLTSRIINPARDWFLLVIITLLIAILGGGLAFILSRGPSDEDLYLLVDKKEEAFLNRGLMDNVLDFYIRKATNFDSFKNSSVQFNDPSI